MNPNQPQTGQNPAQYMSQYAGYMPTNQTNFYAGSYAAYPAYSGYPAGTMDPQYMGYYGMTGALPTAPTVPTSQTASTQVRFLEFIWHFICINLNLLFPRSFFIKPVFL